MAAKKVKIDWCRVDKYLQAHCSGAGIASLLGIHENTLYSRCKADHGVEFGEYSNKKKGEGKELLRAKMFEQAMKGDRTIMIWLSKQYLGMTDKTDLNVDFARMPEDQLIYVTNQLIKQTRDKVYEN